MSPGFDIVQLLMILKGTVFLCRCSGQCNAAAALLSGGGSGSSSGSGGGAAAAAAAAAVLRRRCGVLD
jgi:hypothetical protein